jgi:phage terminase large subunit GpA-like protein
MTPANQIETEFYKQLSDQPVVISPMYMHWNMAGYDEEYFLQLMAEVVKKEKKGRRYVRYYKQVRERNEAIDTAVLCLAALRILKPNWGMLVQRLVKGKKNSSQLSALSIQQETEDNSPPPPLSPLLTKEGMGEVTTNPQPPTPAVKRRRIINRGQGGWVNAWR